MTVPLILAIEPDAGQASRLASIARGLKAELVLAESADRALAALGNRVPDVILTPALLLPRDETALADRLRELGDRAAHVQTLTIPMFATGATPARTGGMLSALRRQKTRAAEPDGCDPDVFAEQVAAYTARAANERNGHQGAADDERQARADAEALEEQRVAEEARAAEELRIAEERRLAEDARATEALRIAEERRLAEEARAAEARTLAEEARAAEERRRAEDARVAEELRIAEERRRAEEARAAEELRIAEERRLAEEARAAEARRLAEEARAAEERRRAEDARVAEELRIAEERRRAEEARAAEELRIAEERRLAEEARAAEAFGSPAESDTRDWIAVDLGELGQPQPIRSARVHGKPATKNRKKPDQPRGRQQTAQDEWSFFDPNQVRFAALLAKLDEISRAGQPARYDRR